MRAVKGVVSTVLFAGVLCLSAGVVQAKDTLCVSKMGPVQIHNNPSMLNRWDGCRAKFNVVAKGFNTINLTWNLSAAYDPNLNTYTTAAAGGTTEFTSPGEYLVVLDKVYRGRSLIYSMTSHRTFFANLQNMSEKLLSVGEFTKIKQAHNDANLYTTTVGTVPFYPTSKFNVRGEFGSGRMVVERDSTFDPKLGEMIQVECVKGKCQGEVGWIPREKLAEFRIPDAVSNPFPAMIEYPTRYLFKACGRPIKSTTARELTADISAKITGTNIIGFEFGAAMQSAYKRSLEVNYPADLEIEWTVFTSVHFGLGDIDPGIFYEKGWVSKRSDVIIIAKVTRGCAGTEAQSRFEIITPAEVFRIGSYQRDLGVTNSADVLAFVLDVQSVVRNRVAQWQLRNIASALSTDRN